MINKELGKKIAEIRSQVLGAKRSTVRNRVYSLEHVMHTFRGITSSIYDDDVSLENISDDLEKFQDQIIDFRRQLEEITIAVSDIGWIVDEAINK